jgi:hypothetical protein
MTRVADGPGSLVGRPVHRRPPPKVPPGHLEPPSRSVTGLVRRQGPAAPKALSDQGATPPEHRPGPFASAATPG